MPYKAKGISDSFTFDMTVGINAGMPVQKVISSHVVNINYPDKKRPRSFCQKTMNTHPIEILY